MITVIMPCFNASNSVARAIASIQAQTLSDWELIVIDDGSTDGSADIADQFAREDSRIRLIRR
ncbi:MAG: glycosyltransferase, partial [Planctomycetales bacterium]